MRSSKTLQGLSLRKNVSLLALAIVCAIVAGFPDKEAPRIACLVIGWALTSVATVPSLFAFLRERMRKGKATVMKDPNTIIAGWEQLCRAMGIEENIKVKVFPDLRNAYATNRTTIEIGQPVLDGLDSVSIRAVFVHELAHHKIDRARKPRHLLWFLVVVTALATVPWLVFTYSVGPLGSACFTFSVLPILVIGFMGIAARFLAWPDEYEADLIAKQYVSREAVISFLTGMAALRKMDVTRDFYRHPSINKRKANLDWSEETRFRKWYLDL